MRVGAVDIGTNTVRLLLAEAMPAGGGVVLRNVARHEIITKLGEGLDATGRLGREPMGRALAGLERYATIMNEAGVVAAGGVATSATRSATNGPEFARQVTETLGFAPRVIDGVEEARLTFLGATAHLDLAAVCCVIDVGGGSTEFVTGRRRPEYAVSIDIGSVRLTERVATLGLGTPAEVRAHVDRLFREVAPPSPPAMVLGSGGTFTTLAGVALGMLPSEVESGDDISLSMDEVVAVVDHLLGMSTEEIAALPSVAPGRAEVLQGGVVCAERAVARVGARSVQISVNDILDGVAIELGAGRWHASPAGLPQR